MSSTLQQGLDALQAARLGLGLQELLDHELLQGVVLGGVAVGEVLRLHLDELGLDLLVQLAVGDLTAVPGGHHRVRGDVVGLGGADRHAGGGGDLSLIHI